MSLDGSILFSSSAVLLGLVAFGILLVRWRRLRGQASDTQRRLDESEERHRGLVETMARDVTHLKRAEALLRAEKRLSEDLVAVARATSEGADLQATLRNTLRIANTLTAPRGPACCWWTRAAR